MDGDLCPALIALLSSFPQRIVRNKFQTSCWWRSLHLRSKSLCSLLFWLTQQVFLYRVVTEVGGGQTKRLSGLFNDPSSVSDYAYSEQWIAKRHGSKLSWSNWRQLSRRLPEGTEESHDRVAGLRADILTWYLPSRMQKCDPHKTLSCYEHSNTY
jgi:hypothetical protein